MNASQALNLLGERGKYQSAHEAPTVTFINAKITSDYDAVQCGVYRYIQSHASLNPARFTGKKELSANVWEAMVEDIEVAKLYTPLELIEACRLWCMARGVSGHDITTANRALKLALASHAGCPGFPIDQSEQFLVLPARTGKYVEWTVIDR